MSLGPAMPGRLVASRPALEGEPAIPAPAEGTAFQKVLARGATPAEATAENDCRTPSKVDDERERARAAANAANVIMAAQGHALPAYKDATTPAEAPCREMAAKTGEPLAAPEASSTLAAPALEATVAALASANGTGAPPPANAPTKRDSVAIEAPRTPNAAPARVTPEATSPKHAVAEVVDAGASASTPARSDPGTPAPVDTAPTLGASTSGREAPFTNDARAATVVSPGATLSAQAPRAAGAKPTIGTRGNARAAHIDVDAPASPLTATSSKTADTSEPRRVDALPIDAAAPTADKPLTHVSAPSPEGALDARTADARAQLHASVVSAMNHMTMRREASGHIDLPEIGRVEVTAHPNGAEVDVRIAAARPETARAIHDHVAQITADLRAGDVPLRQVTVGSEGGSHGFDRPRTSDDSRGTPSGQGEGGDDAAPIARPGPRVRIVL